MPTKQKVVENLDWVTERISNRVWTISLAVLATCLGYLIESSKNEDAFLASHSVVIPAAFALLALVFDLLQYFSANRQNLVLLRKLEKSGENEGLYSTSDLWFRLRNWSYLSKIIACMLSACILIAITVSKALIVAGGP